MLLKVPSQDPGNWQALLPSSKRRALFSAPVQAGRLRFGENFCPLVGPLWGYKQDESDSISSTINHCTMSEESPLFQRFHKCSIFFSICPTVFFTSHYKTVVHQYFEILFSYTKECTIDTCDNVDGSCYCLNVSLKVLCWKQPPMQLCWEVGPLFKRRLDHEVSSFMTRLIPSIIIGVGSW